MATEGSDPSWHRIVVLDLESILFEKKVQSLSFPTVVRGEKMFPRKDGDKTEMSW